MLDVKNSFLYVAMNSQGKERVTVWLEQDVYVEERTTAVNT